MDHLSTLPLLSRPHFTRQEALAWGETDATLHSALRAGLLVRLRFGVYVRAAHLETLDERGRHLLLARAVVAQQRGRVALAGPTAALSRGFDVFGHDLTTVHLARLDAGSARRETGVVHHRVGAAVTHAISGQDELLVVSPEDAVWQTALISSLEGAVVTLDSALHRRRDLREPIARAAARGQHRAGSRTARAALRLARAKSESAGESLTRVACYRHGIPEPTLQHEVVDHLGLLIGRADFWWEPFRMLGEFDGQIKYERLLLPGETSTKAVVREKKREDAMRATLCGMSRFVWSEVQPDSAARRMAKLRHELEQSRRLYVRVG